MKWLNGPLRLGHLSEAGMAALHDEQSRRAVTYKPIGIASSNCNLTGYRRDRAELSLGAGTAIFNIAFDSLVNWRAHTGAGFTIFPASIPVREGDTVVLHRSFPFGYLTLCCRVLYMIDEVDRRGFAYGTLPMHLERGEQVFIIERDANGANRFVIESLSRPAHSITRVLYPITRLIQKRVAKAYLLALTSSIVTASR
jgi:uncharacterized protein (UPF0548 family)